MRSNRESHGNGPNLLVPRSKKPCRYAMRKIHYTLYRENSDFVVQCLDCDISTFGSTEKEALDNLKEAVELYLEDSLADSPEIKEVKVGELSIARSKTMAKRWQNESRPSNFLRSLKPTASSHRPRRKAVIELHL